MQLLHALVDIVQVFNKFFFHQADIGEFDYKINIDGFNKQRHSHRDWADPTRHEFLLASNNFLSVNYAFNHQPEPAGPLPVLLQLLSARPLHLLIVRHSGTSAASDRRGGIPASGGGCVVSRPLQLYLYLRVLPDDGLYLSCRRQSLVTWHIYSTLYLLISNVKSGSDITNS
ncbi:hypothetical protein QBC46DRAFT_364914 [Diplogelasinospora grovesii]|uniref:Uncharacterized protein n=1 Tax=Diplogelasinospora grovesii TaxID=303347 RepID=A0AAN6N546_9PEZI|nr:hypothetical protein QBC46DRAFT_364914 [Diplogelasinospora grovesii]